MAIIEVLKKISDTVWEIPVSYKEGMRVPARIYGTEKLIREMDDAVYDQITNVATLSYTITAICDRTYFEKFADNLGAEVSRAKGFVKFSDATYLFNFVAGR